MVPGNSGRKGGDEAVSGKKDDTERKPATAALTDEQKKAVEQCKKGIDEASSLKELDGISKILKDGKAFYIKDDGSPEYVSLPDEEIRNLEGHLDTAKVILGKSAERAEERKEEPHTDDVEESSVSGDDIEGQTVTDDAAREKGILDALVTIMKKAGLKVHVDADNGQSVLNREKVRTQRMLSGLEKAASTIRGWLKSGERGKVFVIELPESTQRKVRDAMGRDFDSHNITANGIAHSLKNHGENGNKLNERSIPLREEDTELIP